VTLAHLTLIRAVNRVVEKIDKLEPHLDDPESWGEYLNLVTILATIASQIRPEVTGELLTTSQMAARMNISAKTLLKRRAKGQAQPAVVMGKRGRAAFRWAVR
jgi:hypothetical protein